MQLNDLRAHPVIKILVQILFWLIIVSFVFFYGWQKSMNNKVREEARIASYHPPSGGTFGGKTAYIFNHEVQAAKGRVIQRKQGFMNPQLLNFMNQQGASLAWLASEDEAIQEAMDYRILQDEAHRLGLVVSTSEINGFIKNAFQKPEDLKNFLQRREISLDQLIEELRAEQLALRAQRIISTQARLSLYELWLEYLLAKEKIKLRLADYKVDDFEPQVTVSDEEAAKYLADHPKDFEVPAKRRYAFVKVTRDEIEKKVKFTPEDVQAYYEQNLSKFDVSEGVHVEDLFAPVTEDQPTSAAQKLVLAVLESRTTNSLKLTAEAYAAKNPTAQVFSRDLGFLANDDKSKTQFGLDLVNQAFAIGDDQFSAPVSSPRGVHIIHRISYRAQGPAPFDEIREKVEKAYVQAKGGDAFNVQFSSLRDEIKRYKSVRDFATGVGLKDELTTMVAVNNFFIPEIGSLAEHRSYLTRLRPNELSDLLPSPSAAPTFLTALQVIEEIPSHIPTLSEARTAVDNMVKRTKARELAKTAADAAYDAIKNGKDFTEAVATAPKGITEPEPFTRSEVNKIGLPLIDFGQQTTKITQGAMGLSPYGSKPEEALGYAVWNVQSIESPTRDEFKKDRNTFERDVLALQEPTLVQEWLADKRKEYQFTRVRDLKEEEGGKMKVTPTPGATPTAAESASAAKP